MKVFPKDETGFTAEELRRGNWALYADVTCTKCGKEHALTNTATHQTCIECGGV